MVSVDGSSIHWQSMVYSGGGDIGDGDSKDCFDERFKCRNKCEKDKLAQKLIKLSIFKSHRPPLLHSRSLTVQLFVFLLLFTIYSDFKALIHLTPSFTQSGSSSVYSSDFGPGKLHFLGVDGFILYSDASSEPRPPPYYSSADSWVSEELWPKEKSLIHIKLVKPLPKEIPIWELRNKDNYLNDLSLDFDSPFRVLHVNNCVIALKSYYDGYSSEANNQEITRFASNIKVLINGGIKCSHLPLSVLTSFSPNITHLVVRDTGIRSLKKFLFGANKLDKLTRLDVIANKLLTTIQSRAFDGLPRLNYLSLINNRAIQQVALESFTGLKSLEELIFLGNGQLWNQQYFTELIRAASDRILPNLIHLHLCGSPVSDQSTYHHDSTHDTTRYSAQQSRASEEARDDNQEMFETASQELASTDQLSESDGDAVGDGQSDSQHNSVPIVNNQNPVLRSPPSISSSISLHVNYPSAYKPRSSNRSFQKTGIKINKNDFSGLSQVKYLQLSDCDINYMHPSALLPMIKNLIGLNIGGNPNLQSDNLKSVLSIFYANNLNSYRLEAEEQLANSSYLPQFNLPVRIGLDKLDLSYSIGTSTVPKDLLTVISKTTITELYIKKVSWKQIKEGDIPPMPNLRVLHIDHSQIEFIDEKAFVGLDELIKLSLKGNYIKELPLFLLEPLRKLEYLDLSGYKAPPGSHQQSEINTALEIPRKAFVHGTHLKEVNLSYKNLTQLPRYLFIGLFKLEKLHLRGCNLKYIEYLTFFPLKSIIYIDLSENSELIANVRSTEEDTFVGLEAVEMIRLSNCNLTSEDINDFNVFRRMHEHVHLLDLSHNQIDFIAPQTLQNFSELRHIDLSHNRIRSWQNFTIFSKNLFITTLDISHNQLTHITPEMLGDFRNLKNLSFASNPLQCECDWEGPLLLLDQKQKKGSQHLNHQKIQDHIEQLVNRQQEIVSTAFASLQTPPKSIIEWLNTTTIHFLRDRHPLRSTGYYFCHSASSPNLPPIVFKEFFLRDCPKYRAFRSAKFSVAVLALITCAVLLLAVFLLVIAFIYNSTIRNLLSMVDDDFLHNYQYDAFVSYNVNDSEWVFNKLVPNLEEMPGDFQDLNPQSASKDNIGHPIKSKIKLCIYDRDFIAGRPISECITESIRNSRKVILVISSNFARSPWCRFETDLAHNTLMDQNREGLILIKLEEISREMLEKVAPQIHFLLKTRIYLSWSTDQKEQEIFWKKLRRALGFNKPYPYGAVKQYYKNYVGALTKERRHSVVLAGTKDDVKVSFSKCKIESDPQLTLRHSLSDAIDLTTKMNNDFNSRDSSNYVNPNISTSQSYATAGDSKDANNNQSSDSEERDERISGNRESHSSRQLRHEDNFNPQASPNHGTCGTSFSTSYDHHTASRGMKDDENHRLQPCTKCFHKQLDDLQEIIVEKCRNNQLSRVSSDRRLRRDEVHLDMNEIPSKRFLRIRRVHSFESSNIKLNIAEPDRLGAEEGEDEMESNSAGSQPDDSCVYRYEKQVKESDMSDGDDEIHPEDTDQDSTSGISINDNSNHECCINCLACHSELSEDEASRAAIPGETCKHQAHHQCHFVNCYCLSPGGSPRSSSSSSLSPTSSQKLRHNRLRGALQSSSSGMTSSSSTVNDFKSSKDSYCTNDKRPRPRRRPRGRTRNLRSRIKKKQVTCRSRDHVN